MIRITLIIAFTVCAAVAQAPSTPGTSKDNTMTHHATGSFDVKLAPQATSDPSNANFARMSMDKQFHGDLEATSKGEMLSSATSVKGSAGYVAMELVTGTLQGRSGSFTLQHSASMNRGTPQLSITVVPDSGTGQLQGITGKMDIRIEPGGKHYYDFAYTLRE
ncbi:MAG TPA: DUF3224 domain-containing protein [Terriglobales bacterium]|nr:DUF3224 domain-containing protein [Terriglobales bacterium]